MGGFQIWDAESGALHIELNEPESNKSMAVATFLSADGQQCRLVAGWSGGQLRIHDLDGSVLHDLNGHTDRVIALACVEASSAAPHHPRVVSTSGDHTAKVWDGETGEMLAELRGGAQQGVMVSVVVWKEHMGGHDRIATSGDDDGGHDGDKEEERMMMMRMMVRAGTHYSMSEPFNIIIPMQALLRPSKSGMARPSPCCGTSPTTPLPCTSSSPQRGPITC
jgi:hypothetical protein